MSNEVGLFDRVCQHCAFWISNGGILGFGYCYLNDFGYRKFSQSCKKWVSVESVYLKNVRQSHLDQEP